MLKINTFVLKSQRPGTIQRQYRLVAVIIIMLNAVLKRIPSSCWFSLNYLLGIVLMQKDTCVDHCSRGIVSFSLIDCLIISRTYWSMMRFGSKEFWRVLKSMARHHLAQDWISEHGRLWLMQILAAMNFPILMNQW